MANLSETTQWEANVPSIADTDAAEGAPSGSPNLGVVNQPALALANRTSYLKAVVDAIGTPSFQLPGLGYVSFNDANGLAYYYRQINSTLTGARNLDYQIKDTEAEGDPNFGCLIQQTFRRPKYYNNLSISLIQWASRTTDCGSLCFLVSKKQTGAGTPNITAIAFAEMSTYGLTAGGWGAALNLSATAAGDELCFNCFYQFPSLVGLTTFTANFGHIQSTWSLV